MDVGFAALGAFGREEHHRRAGELTADLAAIGAELLDHFVVELGHRRHSMTPRLDPEHPGLSAPLAKRLAMLPRVGVSLKQGHLFDDQTARACGAVLS